MKYLILTIFMFLPAYASASAGNCSYQFNLDNSKVKAKGFKFTEKVGVGAEFKNFSLEKNKPAADILKLMSGVVLTVDLKSIDSKNPARDMNLKQTLLNGLTGGAKATVRVTEVLKDKILAELTLNGKSKKISFDYTTDKAGVITANGSFDALDFTMFSQIKSLKKRCNELHKGKDGQSVTWSTFDLEVKAVTQKICS